MDLELINKNCSGIYVVSFNMEKPMVYHQPFPSSNKLIDKTMIKVGKCKNIKKRMGEYRSIKYFLLFSALTLYICFFMCYNRLIKMRNTIL